MGLEAMVSGVGWHRVQSRDALASAPAPAPAPAGGSTTRTRTSTFPPPTRTSTTSPEFLFQEEALLQCRSWGENLTYYTGVGYLSGAVAGAAVGLREAAHAAERGDTAKIRANRLLNSCGSAGRRVGNRLGVIGLLYAGMVTARDGQDDWINSLVAGLGTGALFRAAQGPRSAAVGGVLAMAAKQAAKRYAPAF
ncbi:hypothetical protein CFC21_035816 [Triticum aestivum]|uniref:Uncharacterized protein n=4 Tax=Triticinae TaxID=1648030 RepID=A0A9R1JMY3_WHEAT|nr:hypothetical protein CFC21_035816 [Triticum aestivum]